MGKREGQKERKKDRDKEKREKAHKEQLKCKSKLQAHKQRHKRERERTVTIQMHIYSTYTLDSTETRLVHIYHSARLLMNVRVFFNDQYRTRKCEGDPECKQQQ